MTGDLTAFIAARLSEDEAVAKAAAGQAAAEWAVNHYDDPEWPGSRTSCAVYAGGEAMIYDEGTPSVQEALHIARHDPARVLREVEAKRAILAAHALKTFKYGSPDPHCAVCLTGRGGYQEDWSADPWPCLTVREVAAIWSGHPDYRKEWKPL